MRWHWWRTLRPGPSTRQSSPDTPIANPIVDVVLDGEQENSHVITAKRQTPPDPGRPSLLHLPDDINFSILGLIHDVNPESVLEFALVCSYCYEQARYVQHRQVAINLANDSTATRNRLDYMTQNNLLSAIQTLRIITAPAVSLVPRRETNEERAARLTSREVLTHLAQVIAQMTGLREVYWHEGKRSMNSMPEELVLMLKKHSRISLHLSFDSITVAPSVPGQFPNHVPPQRTVAALDGVSNLVALDVRVTFSWFDLRQCREFMIAVRKLLLASPNLRKLSMDVVDRDGTGSRYILPDSVTVGLGFSRGSRPAALEELQISDYPWGVSSHPNVGLGNGKEQEYWADKFDWSKLRCFRERNPTLAEHVMPYLVGLKEVEFNLEGPHHRRPDMINGILNMVPSTLESISINSLTHVRLNSITLHASGLRKLVIHTPEAWTRKEPSLLSSYGWNQDGFVNHYYLESLCNTLPQLEELVIDMDRGGTKRDDWRGEWPWSMLNILAGFPHLRQLGIWFELGAMGDRRSLPKPSLTWREATYIYERIRARSKEKGKPIALDRLELSAGTPDAVSFVSKVRSDNDDGDWARNNATNFVCELALWHEEGYTIRCPRLNNAQNRELEHMQRVTRDGFYYSAVESASSLFRAALEGPASR